MVEAAHRISAPEESEVKIALRSVCKSFGSKRVLAGINLSVSRGESLIIMGASGCGKSVLLKLIIGLLEADSGTIAVDGCEIQHWDISARSAAGFSMSMLFQYAALFDSLTVRENVVFGLRHGGDFAGRGPLSAAEIHDIADAKLAEVGLDVSVVGGLYPAELSGGMKKRVGLARALATSPDILFFDEPTAGLDPIMGHVIDALIVDSVRARSATALTITHDIASAKRIGDNCALLHGGEIVWYGAVSDMEMTDNCYMRQFMHGDIDGPMGLPGRRL